MDKLDRNRTITIKINHNETELPKKKEEKKVVDEPKNNEEEQQTIEVAKEEVAAANVDKEEEFEWILPTAPVESSKKKPSAVVTYSSKKSTKKKNGSYARLIAAVVCAVVVGLGFMYVALKTITASDTTKPTVAKVPDEASTTKEKKSEASSTKPSGATVVLPSMPIQVVQGGVYSSLELAEKQKGLIESRDLPVVILPQQDKFYLLLFASDSLERAKAVSKSYKEKGIDSFWKEFKVGASGQKKVSKENGEIVNDSIALYKKLTSAATTLMITSEKVDGAELQSEMKKLQDQKGGSKEVVALIPPLEKAVEQLSSSGDGVSSSLEMQKHLLDFIRVYNALVP